MDTAASDVVATQGCALRTVELAFTEAMRAAVDHAFEVSRHQLALAHGLRPFITVYVDGALDVSELAGATVEAVYAAARALVARVSPEFYVLAYDGFIETTAGVQDALTCEVARKNDALAQVLAVPYAVEDGAYTFRGTYGSAGQAAHLYPQPGQIAEKTQLGAVEIPVPAAPTLRDKEAGHVR